MKTRTNLFKRLQRNFLRCLTSGVFILGGIGGVSAQPLLDPVELLSDFVGVDTVNPPGNEANAVAFYARYLDELGIAYETGESAPGRGNLWARLKGGAAPGLMLLQHTDVVPGDPRYWLSDPLQAEIREGYLYGRGVVDMKGTGIAQFLAFVAIAQSGVVLNRDLSTG